MSCRVLTAELYRAAQLLSWRMRVSLFCSWLPLLRPTARSLFRCLFKQRFRCSRGTSSSPRLEERRVAALDLRRWFTQDMFKVATDDSSVFASVFASVFGIVYFT